MQKRPLIGITTYGRNDQGDFRLPGAYVDAVRDAGGFPLLLPPGERDPSEIMGLIDGLIFAGGGDVDPSLYGAKPHPKIERVNAERDSFEISLARTALEGTKPVLGICRGMQLLNVAGGGTLIVDVPETVGSRVKHRSEQREPVEHTVLLEKQSRLAAILGKSEVSVRSLHHQGLDKVATGWRIVGRSEDDLVEAMEREGHPWMISVLWHPEMPTNDGVQRKLFADMVEAALAFRQNTRERN